MASSPIAVPTRRVETAWLYSPLVDLSILLVPFALVGTVVMLTLGQRGIAERAYAGWIAQFILGNSTHVILTFLLLGVRREMLHATASHQKTITYGCAAVFLGASAGFYALQQTLPNWTDFALAIVVLLATHHTLSQTKGIWSLYGLRARSIGLSAPTPRLRSLHQHYVAVGLLLIAIRFLFVPKDEFSMFPFVLSVPLMDAPLPFEVTYLLVLAWLVFAGLLIAELMREETINASMLTYLGINVVAVAICIYAPVWGSILTAGIHGLEYAFLTRRMLQPSESEPNAPVRRGWVVPIMILCMMPLFAIGLVAAPFTPKPSEPGTLWILAPILLNGVVLAHYFADAFIYRFRVPEIRRVALARMRFG